MPDEAPAPVAPARDWSITLAGTTYPLDPTMPNLVALERSTNRTIFELVDAGSEGRMTIDQLTAIACCLSVATVDDPMMGFAKRAMVMGAAPTVRLDDGRTISGTDSATRMPLSLAAPIAEAIVDLGLIVATARLLMPLATIIAGRIEAANPKAA